MNDDGRSELLGNYLRQQSYVANSGIPIDNRLDIPKDTRSYERDARSEIGDAVGGGSSSRELVVQTENISLEEFKDYVKKYMEIDNWIKKAQHHH